MKVPDFAREALNDAKKASGVVRETYLDKTEIRHIRRLSELVSKQFKNEILVSAAWLSRVPPRYLRHRDHRGGEVALVLEDYNECIHVRTVRESRGSVMGPDDALIHRLSGKSPLARILFVYDHLVRADPNGRLLNWTQSFRQDPSRWTGGIPEIRPGMIPVLRGVVGPAARRWGMWQEGNIIQNAALLCSRPALFNDLAEFAVSQDSASGPVREFEREVADLLLRRQYHHVRWEWHHVASLQERLQAEPRERWPQVLFRCGFVTVVCPDGPACYVALGRLHDRLDHQQKEIRDHVGRPSSAGYQALHSILRTATSGFLPVRLTPNVGNTLRNKLRGTELLDSMQSVAASSIDAESITVFTPHGEAKRLRKGASVLNFAYHVHTHLVARAWGARLNGSSEVFGLLHKLDENDMVELVLDDTPAPRQLPAGWEEVLGEHKNTVQRVYRTVWKDYLLAEGRKLLRERLHLIETDDVTLEVLVDQAQRALSAEDSGLLCLHHSTWLRDLAFHLSNCSSPEPAWYEPKATEVQVRRLVKLAGQARAAMLRSFENADLDLPEEARRLAHTVRSCEKCKPQQHDSLVYTLERGRITIHRRGRGCAPGAPSCSLQPRISMGQFFVIETNNRTGVALDILGVFQDERIDIVEIAARRLGRDWGVVRLEVDPFHPELTSSVSHRLLRIPDVSRVFCPGDPPQAILEEALPDRQVRPVVPTSIPEPYVFGNVVSTDNLFYGRDMELGLLTNHLYRNDPWEFERSGGALGVFVSGPLKVGKSSLLLRFKALLHQNPEMKVIPVYLKAGWLEGWAEYEGRLLLELERSVVSSGRTWFGDFPQGKRTFAEWVEAFRDHPMRPWLVLLIDEASRLLICSQESDEDLARIREFRKLVQHVPGILTVLAGPRATFNKLQPELQALLEQQEALELGGFSRRHTADLIRARHFVPWCQVEAPQEIVDRVFALTRGDPFWVTGLASNMWRRARCESSTRVTLKLQHLAAAEEEFVSKSSHFRFRIAPKHARTDRNSLYWKIALALLDGHELNGDVGTGLNLEQLATTTGCSDYFELEATIDEMVGRGSVARMAGETCRWCLSAPLMTRFLQRAVG
jgi:(p)ppGpp synthase/HD superfamily hydrolase